jgi:ribosome biogenesis GTPase A
MKPELVKEAFSQFKKEIVGLFARLHELSVETGRPELKEHAASLLASVNQPFLFVVVGEVKAGKSSFINALLGQPLCKVAPDPCTDAIHKIVYADAPYERGYGPHLKELGLPAEILREVAIVDTPGTNSIIDQHQEITERFIPESDLVIFVFPALNPYAKTSWEVFDLVREQWRKKIVFLLQQADRASEEELAVNTRRVAEYAQSRGMQAPVIFQVSAKRALSGDPASGMGKVWDYIRETITGGKHYRLKMESLLGSASTILEMLDKELARQVETLRVDQNERGRIEKFLERSRISTQRGVESLQQRLLNAYDTHTAEAYESFEDGLSVPRLVVNSIRGVFKKRSSFSAWVEDLHKDFAEAFNREAELLGREGAAELTDNVTNAMSMLLETLKDSKATVTLDARRSLAAGDARRGEAIDAAIANLFALLGDNALREKIRPEGLRKIGDHAVLSMFITTVGGILATSTKMIVFDITGGVFAAIGALLAVHTLAFKRRTILKRFREGFDQGREALDAQLAERLALQVQKLFHELSNAFQPFFENIAERETKLAELQTSAKEIAEALEREKGRVTILE